jgi:uncharacterized membrane protein YbhN (UPF0104 family)
MGERVDRTARPRWKRLGVSAVKLAIAALVLWFVGRHVARSWEALGRHGKPLRFEPAWLVLAGGLYLAGLVFSGVFFHQVMRASPSPVRRYPAIRAYLVSHLAKYVPGKAMVVVVRAGMVVPYGAKGVTAAVATFYETLAMMAAGGLIAAVGFATTSTRSDTFISLDAPEWWGVGRLLTRIDEFAFCAAIGLALGLAFLVVVLPPVFGRLSRLVTTPFGGAGEETSPRFSGRLLGWGLLWSTCCWVLLGLSQLAVVRAVSPLSPADAARLTPLVIGSVAFATVAGFVVAVMPGGLGVREGVLMAVLGPAVGDGVAVAAAILLRLVWIAAELVAGGILVMIRPRPIREPVADRRIPAEMGQHHS